MSEEKCCNCLHFLQHYCLSNGKLLRVYCGHCTFGGAKRKRPDTKACMDFIPGPSDTEAFASKEYLSKKLLEYVLDLELLPEIAESPSGKKKRKQKSSG